MGVGDSLPLKHATGKRILYISLYNVPTYMRNNIYYTLEKQLRLNIYRM